MKIGSKVEVKSKGFGVISSINQTYSNGIKVLLNDTGRFFYAGFEDILSCEDMVDVKPKFKVGDRVTYDKATSGTIGTIKNIKQHDINGHTFIYSVKGIDPLYLSGAQWMYEEHLTLTESKPECKFKVGQIVDAENWVKQESFFKDKKNIGLCECRIGEITDEFVYIEQIRVVGFAAHLSIEDANKYLKYPEKKKEKWSVGTYVEMLEEHMAFHMLTNHIFEIIEYDGKYIKINVNGIYHQYVVNSKEFNFEEEYHFKWHETKPEKKEFNIDLQKAANNLEKGCEKLSPTESIFDALNIPYRPCKFTKTTSESYYGTGEFDLNTLQDVVDWMKNQPIVRYCDPIDYNRMYPLTWEDCFSQPLKKRRITISNIKPIKININKKRVQL